jgi:hypothetical protein
MFVNIKYLLLFVKLKFDWKLFINSYEYGNSKIGFVIGDFSSIINE